MSGTKYGHLVKTLVFEELPHRKRARFASNDLEGLELIFVWGAWFESFGEFDLGVGRHLHPCAECFVLTSLDYNNPNHVGAEIEVEMGEEGEKQVLDAPGIVVTPTDFAHAPIIIRDVNGKSFGSMMIYLGGEYTHSNVPVKGEPPSAEKKYRHLVQKFKLRDTKRKSGGDADYISSWSGEDIEGINLNLTWAFHTGLGAGHEKDPHTHPNDEILLFAGLDASNPEYLGAEIEIAMGDEQEIQVIDTSTLVVVPKGLVHCPLITRKVDKPFGFSTISLDNEPKTTWLGG